jgi:leucine-rich PPR motif-containing protein
LGEHDKIMGAYYEMISLDIKPTEVTFNVMLEAFGNVGDFDKLKQVLQLQKEAGLKPNIFNYNTLLKYYGKYGKIESLNEIFNEMMESNIKPDAITFNTIFYACGKIGDLDGMNRYYKMMKEMNIVPDDILMNCILLSYLRLKREDYMKSSFQEMIEAGVKPNVKCYHYFLTECTRKGNIQDAKEYIKDMIQRGLSPDIECYNIIMRAQFRARNTKELLESYDEVKSKSIRPNLDTRNILVKYLAEEGEYDVGLRIMEELESQFGIIPDIKSYSYLLDCLRKKEDIERMKELFKKMNSNKKVDLISYNIILAAMASTGRTIEMDKYVEEMKNNGIHGDVITWTTLMEGYCKRNEMDRAEEVFRMSDTMRLDATAFNVMIEAYGRLKNLNKMEEYFEKMKEIGIPPDNATYNLMIIGYLKTDNLECIKKITEEMKSKGIAPDEFTVAAMFIGKIVKTGIISPSGKYIDDMRLNGIRPSISMYNKIASAISKSMDVGKLSKLVQVIINYNSNLNPSYVICRK